MQQDPDRGGVGRLASRRRCGGSCDHGEQGQQGRRNRQPQRQERERCGIGQPQARTHEAGAPQEDEGRRCQSGRHGGTVLSGPTGRRCAC